MRRGHQSCYSLFVAFGCWLFLAQSSAVGQSPEIQFHKLAKSVTQFHDAYGYYPEIFDDAGVFRIGADGNSEKFVEAMAGQTWSGKRVTLHGNKDSTRFYDFREGDFSKKVLKQIVDRLGNSDITIVVDYDNDGDVDIPDDVGQSTIDGKVHAYSRYDDGELCISTWTGLTDIAKTRIKAELDRSRWITSAVFTGIAILMFSAWWYVRDKVIG